MNDAKERARLHLEDAVALAREAGMTAAEIRSEVEYALENEDE